MNLGLLERKKYESSMFHPNNSTCSSSRERERERERERCHINHGVQSKRKELSMLPNS
jgi:hypothetical protein